MEDRPAPRQEAALGLLQARAGIMLEKGSQSLPGKTGGGGEEPQARGCLAKPCPLPPPGAALPQGPLSSTGPKALWPSKAAPGASPAHL